MPDPLPPTLATTVDLAELILAFSVRLTAVTTSCDPCALVCPLNALPRSAAPLVTKCALMHLVDVDMDTAAKRGDLALLRFMLTWSKQPRGRPIQYTSDKVMEHAMVGGFEHVMDWLDKHLYCDWGCNNIMKACGTRHGVLVLDWWKRRGFGPLDSLDLVKLAWKASCEGQVPVLDWLVANVDAGHVHPSDRRGSLFPFRSAFGDEGTSSFDNVMGAAAAKGHVHVLDWWWSKAQAGLVLWPKLGRIIEQAFTNNQASVLAWCEAHPAVVYEHQARKGLAQSWLMSATQHPAHLLEWVDRLGLSVQDMEHLQDPFVPFLYANLPAVQWLHAKGCIVGCRLEMVCYAARAKNAQLDLFEWIHASIASDSKPYDPMVRVACARQNESDPFDPALRNGHVHVADWLVQHGYTLYPQKLTGYFEKASDSGTTQVLDWLMDQVKQRDMSVDLFSVAYPTRFHRATTGGHVRVLEWWLTCLKTHVFPMKPEPGQRPALVHSSLADACRQGYVDVLEWWLRHADVLQDWFTLTDTYLATCSNYVQLGTGKSIHSEHQVVILNTWWHAGYPIPNPLMCVYAASAVGNTQALDWLLHVANVSTDTFGAAYHHTTTSAHSLHRFLCRLHPRSSPKTAVWWWTNMPHVCMMRVDRKAVAHNPIHAHLLKEVLKLPSIEVENPVDLSAGGNVAMLQYLAQSGELDLLNDACEEALVEATWQNELSVLEWWKDKANVVNVKRPAKLSLGGNVHPRVTQWWIDWGLG